MAVGEIVGGFVNAATSMINAAEERDQERRLQEQKQKAVAKALAQSNTDYQKMENLLSTYNDDRYNWADDATYNQFMDLVNNYDPNAYVYDFDPYEYDKTVDDFIDPNAQKISEMAGLQTQADAAGVGNAGGTGALAKMGYSRWQAASDLYKQAQDQMYKDQAQNYQQYSDYITNMQNKLNTLSNQQLQKISLLGGNIEKEETAKSDYISDLLGIMGDKAQNNINATLGSF